MHEIIFSFLTSFSLTYFVLPSVIKVAQQKRLFDEPDERRSHVMPTPSLGGIGIFAGILFSVTLWTPFRIFGDLQYILCAFVVIFMMGVKDDISPISPWKKIIGEVIAASLIVFKSKIGISSLFGIFGIGAINPLLGGIISIFTIIVIVNAFNLIDGINGLSSSIAILICVALGVWFFVVGRAEMSILAFSTVGSVLAFLRYNITPARIFMGDTGSLLLGLICSILIFSFLQFHEQYPEHPFTFQSAPAVAIGILIFPLFDTLRVFTTRLARGKSPLHPDRNHIHHLLIDLGLSHMQATGVLVLVSILFMGLVFWLQHLGTVTLLIIILALAAALSGGLFYTARNKRIRKARNQKEQSN